jgi:hypothetical protein
MARTLDYPSPDARRPKVRTGRLTSIALLAAIVSPMFCFGVAFIPASETRAAARLFHLNHESLRFAALPSIACAIGLVSTVRAIWRRNSHDAVLSFLALFFSGAQLFIVALCLTEGVS